LELELEEDVEKTEIHHFVKLARTGDYAAAHDFYDHTIHKHDHFFPVVAEYADMLFEQGSYRRAAEYLERQLTGEKRALEADELQLLELMESLANIYCDGALRDALVQAKRARVHLERIAGRVSTTSSYKAEGNPTLQASCVDSYSDTQVSLRRKARPNQ
jgi:hypothetical protein